MPVEPLISLTNILDSSINVVSALLGTVIGGLISFQTTKHFEKKREEDRLSDLATSLMYRLMVSTGDIFKVKHQIDEMLSREGLEAVSDDQLWTRVLGIYGISEKEIDFEPNELHVFDLKGDGPLVTDIIETIRFRNIIIRSVTLYGEKRDKLTGELQHISEFSSDEHGMSGVTSFDRRERPDLYRSAGELNNMIKQIIDMLNDGEKVSRDLIEKFNSRMAKRFPKGKFRFKIGIADHISNDKNFGAGEVIKEN